MIMEIAIDAVKKLDEEERTAILKIIDEVRTCQSNSFGCSHPRDGGFWGLVILNPGNNEQAVPSAIVTKADAKFVAKLGNICSAISQLPNSTGSIQGLNKSRDLAFATGGRTDTWRGDWGGKPVACKVFRVFSRNDLPKAKELLWKVVPIWKRLEHSNVLPIYGAETTVFQLALVYEWSKNGNILEYLKSKPDAPRSELVIVLSRSPSPRFSLLYQLLQVAKGLQYLHSLDIVHGNLKGVSDASPQTNLSLIKFVQANVLISESGNARVCDYGLTPFISDPTFTVAATPGVVGSSQWLAPELIGPPEGPNPRFESKPADVFAFAMLVVEVYTGRLPFGDEVKPESAMVDIARGKRPDRPQAEHFGLTKEKWKFVERCWDQEILNRPRIDEVVTTWEGSDTKEEGSVAKEEGSVTKKQIPSRPLRLIRATLVRARSAYHKVHRRLGSICDRCICI